MSTLIRCDTSGNFYKYEYMPCDFERRYSILTLLGCRVREIMFNTASYVVSMNGIVWFGPNEKEKTLVDALETILLDTRKDEELHVLGDDDFDLFVETLEDWIVQQHYLIHEPLFVGTL